MFFGMTHPKLFFFKFCFLGMDIEISWGIHELLPRNSQPPSTTQTIKYISTFWPHRWDPKFRYDMEFTIFSTSMSPWRHVMHQRTSACQISFRHAPNRVITGKTFGAHELPGPGPFGNLTVREAVVAVAVPDPKWKEKRAWAGYISVLKGACSTTHNDCRLKVEPQQSLTRNKRYSITYIKKQNPKIPNLTTAGKWFAFFWFVETRTSTA